MKENCVTMIILYVFLPTAKSAVPGTFFWKPRLSLDLNIPITEPTYYVYQPTKDNMREGLVILIEGYKIGMTMMALAVGVGNAEPYLHLNPTTAYYHTNVYRWALRYFSLIPAWLSGTDGNYCETHKVWRRRFNYMDHFMPSWMRKFFPYVDNKEWSKEEKEFSRFHKYAESAFGKHYKYPDKAFTDFRSEQTEESTEVTDSSSKSIS